MSNNEKRYGYAENERGEPAADELFEDEDFEEPDRDSDFAAIYTEVDDEFDDERDTPADDTDERSADNSGWSLVQEEQDELSALTDTDEEEDWEAERDEEEYERHAPGHNTFAAQATTASQFDPDTPERGDVDDAAQEYAAEEEDFREVTLSIGMIVVAVIALLLLAVGGYGVIKQRAEMKEEIRLLQGRLATAAPPSEVTASRAAAEAAEEENRELLADIEQLGRENRNLQAIVAGLESQLAAQQEALEKTPPPAPAPKPTPRTSAPTSEPVATTDDPGSGWFVNFSSYSQRETAENWVKRIRPEQGRAIVAAGESNGRTIYRVRVVDLPDKTAADAVARQLEADFKLPKLWVGELP
ncbi:SPOR domain-containing protein [Mangrovimicrobium sediminis]|uniref:SPOR domain-containing protein n=1 Tax=Mangrovimicrobium sediminis TaxID=2562682 RepID=A0A4Z0M074_9GAMM|nr:SPOR domain-containing protein [Haliea sp. SAOS-164]TGD72768.1 SPOR domain-containing protein [Haliea sp. SAOS-164]